MKFEQTKIWLPLAGCAFVLWLGGYCAFWLSRYGCGETPVGACLASAFGEWLGDVIMFRWVKSHQELIGGLAAVMAATAVIWTALQQRQHAIDDRTEQQEQELEGALLGLKLAALRLEFSSNLQVPPAKLRTLVDNLRAAADNLPRTAQRLSVHTNINCSAADAFLDIIEGGTKDGEAVDLCTLEVRRMAFTMAAYMTKHERLLDGAKYVHNPKLLSKGQAATAAELGITADLDDPYLREWLAL